MSLRALLSRKLDILLTKMLKICKKNRKTYQQFQIDRVKSLIIVFYVMLDQISAALGEDSRTIRYIRTSKTTTTIKKKYSQLSFIKRDAVAH